MSQIFKNHLILSDFDGTFSGSQGVVKKNVDAIEYFKANGGHFTFSTGRLPSVFSRIYPEFKKVVNAPVFMANGAIIYDAEKDAILKKETMLLKEHKKKVLFTSDGNYSEFIDDIVACGVDGFVLEPTTDMKYMAEKYGKTHVIVGNADTRILLSGTKDDIEAEVRRCMDIGKDCPGFFMAVGNHIPANTPVENALYYNAMYEKYSVR